jgi:APA family basic amino acid/polyamine antiporter
VADAVIAGLGAMVGAGLFAGLAPASSLAGRWLLVATVIAAVAAACGCCSTGDQSAALPGPGGGYRYSRDQLGRWPGRMAGGLYLVSRAASGAAIAGCFGAYADPQRPLLPAVGLLVLALAVDSVGLRLPTAAIRVLTVFVLVVLVVVVAACFAIAPPPPTGVPLPPGTPGTDDAGGLLPAAGVLFFAFLGFERVTAPGDDQSAPSPRRLRVVIPLLLVLSVGTYLAVGAAVLRQLGPTRLALSTEPLRDAMDAADASALGPLVAVAALVATAVALLLVIGGGRRTAEVMAAGGDLPSGRRRTAGAALGRALVGGGAVLGVLVAGPGAAIGLAATCALFYYAFTNAAGRLLSKEDRVWPGRTACLGMGLSVLIGMSMPVVDLAVVLGVLVLAGVAGPLRRLIGSVGGTDSVHGRR